MTLEENIKNMGKIPTDSTIKTLTFGSAETIKDFWDKVVEPNLPDYDTMKKWHRLFMDYVNLPNPVYMIRQGSQKSSEFRDKDPNYGSDKHTLRRGFLTKTTDGYWFVYNDNGFAMYILAMALDREIINSLTAKDLLEYLKTPKSIIRFHKYDKEEKERAYYSLNGHQPCISENGYTLAHIFDVNDHYYDDSLGFNNINGKKALEKMNINRGKYSNYELDEKGNAYYRDNYSPKENASKFLRAYLLRYLHPLNYFCAPKDNSKGNVYCEFTDYINNGKPDSRRWRRIAGYKHLLCYAHHKFKEKYKDIYDEFISEIMLPENTFEFFEKNLCLIPSDFYGSEKINAQYGNPM